MAKHAPARRPGRRHKAKRVVIYNHKGGVGKTTLSVHIAAALVEANKRVLLVDSDPQCNLTSYLVDDDVVDAMLDKSEHDDGKTLWSAVKPVRDGTGRARAIRAIPRWKTSHLALLPGDIRLATFENELGESWGDCFQRRPHGFSMMTAISDVVNAAATEMNADYVFYDAGPNIGALNRAIVLDCDFLIVPASCDLFSARALKTLGYSISSWIRDWRTVELIAPDDVALLTARPKLVGYIPQRFRVYGGDIASTQRRYLALLEKQMHADVVEVLREVDVDLAPYSVSQMKLGQVQDFNTLVAASQQEGVPLWDVDAGTPEQRSNAKTIFAQIASKFLQTVEELS